MQKASAKKKAVTLPERFRSEYLEPVHCKGSCKFVEYIYSSLPHVLCRFEGKNAVVGHMEGASWEAIHHCEQENGCLICCVCAYVIRDLCFATLLLLHFLSWIWNAERFVNAVNTQVQYIHPGQITD